MGTWYRMSKIFYFHVFSIFPNIILFLWLSNHKKNRHREEQTKERKKSVPDGDQDFDRPSRGIVRELTHVILLNYYI